jgi:hypothetical protein
VSWLKLDDLTDDHPKWVELGEADSWRWLRVLLYCSRLETDGLVSDLILKRYGVKRARMVALGLLEERENGLWVHDFLEYNPSKAEKDVERERWRDRKRSSRNGANVTGGVTGEVLGGVTGESQPLRAGPVPYPLEELELSKDLPGAREVDVAAAREARARSGWVDNLSQYTGCRYVRGTHGTIAVYDVLGTEPVPAGWDQERPTREEVKAALMLARERA